MQCSTLNTEKCIGCGACSLVCERKAISIQPNVKGFYSAVYDKSLCCNCAKCSKVCPVQNKAITKNVTLQVLAAYNKDQNLRMRESSGGIFSLLSEEVLRKNGAVFGSAIAGDRVEHIIVDSIDDIEKLYGSKYVQSFLGDCYKNIQKRLNDDQIVLFSGTPCQVAGLYKFLGTKHSNLITVDIFCAGVPSPLFYSAYKSNKENVKGKRIVENEFRNKKHGWSNYSMKLVYEDGTTEIIPKMQDPFLNLFNRHYTLSEACITCQYRGLSRMSDISIGDFWGISEGTVIRNDDKGISCVIINSQSGLELWNRVKEKLIYEERKETEALENWCFRENVEVPNDYNKFWDDFSEYGYSYVEKKYADSNKKGIFQRLMRKMRKGV